MRPSGIDLDKKCYQALHEKCYIIAFVIIHMKSLPDFTQRSTVVHNAVTPLRNAVTYDILAIVAN